MCASNDFFFWQFQEVVENDAELLPKAVRGGMVGVTFRFASKSLLS